MLTGINRTSLLVFNFGRLLWDGFQEQPCRLTPAAGSLNRAHSRTCSQHRFWYCLI